MTGTIDGLNNGTTYQVRLTAENTARESQGSLYTILVVSVPDAPGLTISARNGSIEYTITPPSDTGGTPITKYTIYYNNESVDTTTLTGSIPIDEGTTYSVQVSATNANGESVRNESQSIKLAVVTTDEVTEVIDTVNFTTQNNSVDTRPEGETHEIQAGVNGYTTVTYLVTYHDGVEESREETNRVVTPPVTRIVEVGTGIITTDTDTVTENVVQYSTSNVDTDELPVGDTQVQTEGVNGYDTVTYTVTYKDGVETGREESNRVTTPPIDEVILVGTYVDPDPEPEA